MDEKESRRGLLLGLLAAQDAHALLRDVAAGALVGFLDFAVDSKRLLRISVFVDRSELQTGDRARNGVRRIGAQFGEQPNRIGITVACVIEIRESELCQRSNIAV